MPLKNSKHYFEIKLGTGDPFSLYKCRENGAFGYLSTINIFVGQNNSGKSRFLRTLFSASPYEFTLSNFSAEIMHEFIKRCDAKFRDIMYGYETIGGIGKNYFSELSSYDSHFISSNNPIGDSVDKMLSSLVTMSENASSWQKRNDETTRKNHEDIKSEIKAFVNEARREFNKLNTPFSSKGEHRYYFPVLRGMRSFSDNRDHFSERTMKDYFGNLSGDRIVFSGLGLYQRLKELLLGEPEERDLVKQYEEFLSINFFESKPITLIPREGADVVYIKLGKEKQLPIYNLGDGLQNLIILTFPIFTTKERSLFFIEEPDLYMHPGLQRKFLETLLKNKNHQYFLTSHSNHLLDMTLDYSEISVFHFEKTENEVSTYQISNLSEPNNQILRDLGVMNSSVMLSNATIWVEGITDRFYIRCYLAKYLQHLKIYNSERYKKYCKFVENTHYSFVEYQGSNLTHWNFDGSINSEKMKADYLCARALVIADGDILTKGERVDVLSEQLGSRFVILQVKEIENIIPEEVMRSVLSEIFSNFNMNVNTIQFSQYSKPNVAIGRYIDK